MIIKNFAHKKQLAKATFKTIRRFCKAEIIDYNDISNGGTCNLSSCVLCKVFNAFNYPCEVVEGMFFDWALLGKNESLS
jgi:hypothetical protein